MLNLKEDWFINADTFTGMKPIALLSLFGTLKKKIEGIYIDIG